ncbi:hypothetical protein DFQ27_001511 [Actinomortierella ambigua]|uniref:Uncharacterized protein n=1 Tax=Actinomortierella ambigua TaxID=1343610 RepID=A0A9P6U8R3_9FUNG|nr:hypothetical protein DFQ27_001511 [Actinomortierella ambigua]
MEHSTSVQSLVESIDEDDVLRLTEMTKKVVEHSNQGQKRNRIISPPSNTQVPAEFQPSEKTLQLSNQYKAMMESRYAPIFAALDTHQRLPNPLVTLRETMARIDTVPRAIVNKYNTTRKISMEAANTASGGGAANSGGHTSRGRKSKDKYAFVSRVVESQCIWDVDHMKMKAAEIEARYQASASNPNLRYTTPSQSTSVESLVTPTAVMETTLVAPTMQPAMSSPTMAAGQKEESPIQQPHSTHPSLIPTLSIHTTSPTQNAPPLPIPTSAATLFPSTPTTNIGSSPVSNLQDPNALLSHQTHAGETLHQPLVRGEPLMTTTLSPAVTLATQSSTLTPPHISESATGDGRPSLDIPSTTASTNIHTNGSLSLPSETGSSPPPPPQPQLPTPQPLSIHQQQQQSHSLHVPVHPMPLETSGPKRGSILGIFGIKGHKKTGPEESSDKSADNKRRSVFVHHHLGESVSGSPTANSSPRSSELTNDPSASNTSGASISASVSTSSAAVAPSPAPTPSPAPASVPTLATSVAERRSLERAQFSGGTPDVAASPTDAQSHGHKPSTAAAATTTPTVTTSIPAAATTIRTTKGASIRKTSLEEPMRQPGLGHGLLFQSHEDGGSTEDDQPIATWPQGERIDDSQDEADALPHKRSSLRRFTDLIMWKRQHKGLAGLHEHIHGTEPATSTATTATTKRPMDPTVLHLQQQHNNYTSSRLSSSQPSSGRNSLDGTRPKVFSLSRVKSVTSSPVLEPGHFEGGGGSGMAGSMSTPSTTANSTAISPRIGPMTPAEGLQPMQRPGGADKSPLLYPRPSYLSGQSQALSATTSQDRSPSMRAMTPNEDLQQQQQQHGDRRVMEGTGPVLVDIERIPKAILDQLKEQPALADVSWDHDTVDLRPLLASGAPLPTCHEFLGITSTMKAMEGYPPELQRVDVLDIHVQMDYPEPKDYLRMRAHVWDALEMRLDEELKLSEDFVKTASQWAHDRQHDVDHHLKSLSPEPGGPQDYYYQGLRMGEGYNFDDDDDDDDEDGDEYNEEGMDEDVNEDDDDHDDNDDDDNTNDDDEEEEEEEDEEEDEDEYEDEEHVSSESKATESLSETTGDTLRCTDEMEWTDADDHGHSSLASTTVEDWNALPGNKSHQQKKNKKKKTKGKKKSSSSSSDKSSNHQGGVGEAAVRKRGMSFSTSYRFDKHHIAPLETMRANKQRELHAHAGSMSSMYARGGFKANVERMVEAKAELSVEMAECRARLMRLQETTGKSLQEKEQVYKGIIDNFTVEWNDSYFVKLKDVEEQIQGMNQKRIEDPWMDMLLILLSWLVRGLFYLVEGVTLVIIIVRHAWGKAKTTFQTVRVARRERERQLHGQQPPNGSSIAEGNSKLKGSSPNGLHRVYNNSMLSSSSSSSSNVR